MFLSTTECILLGLSLVFLILYKYKDNAVGSEIILDGSLPRSKGHVPVLGALVAFAKNYHRFNEFMYEFAKENNFKSTVMSIPFQTPYVWVFEPKNIEHVLKTEFDSYIKGDLFYHCMTDLLGNGIFNIDGDAWRHQRKTAAHIFTVKNFRDFVDDVFTREMVLLEERLDQVIEQQQGGPLDLQDMFFRFTLDSFAKIGFNVELGCMVAKERIPFADAFDLCQAQVDVRFYKPFWPLEERLTAHGARVRQGFKLIHDFALDLVRKRKIELQEGTCDSNDLLTLFMRQDESWSEHDLAYLLLNFIIAGRDTTAQALSWSVYLLSQHPRCEKKLVQEIQETIGSSKLVTYDTIKGMKYANAVFHEALRLYPSVPKNGKMAIKDNILPDGTFIPKGTQVAFSPYVQGRMPSIYGPDALEFKPERWLQVDFKPSQYEYNVFHCGPRICLGKNMAELEGVFVLVSLLRRFKIKLVDPDSVVCANSITMPMKYGLNVHISHRNE